MSSRARYSLSIWETQNISHRKHEVGNSESASEAALHWVQEPKFCLWPFFCAHDSADNHARISIPASDSAEMAHDVIPKRHPNLFTSDDESLS